VKVFDSYLPAGLGLASLSQSHMLGDGFHDRLVAKGPGAALDVLHAIKLAEVAEIRVEMKHWKVALLEGSLRRK